MPDNIYRFRTVKWGDPKRKLKMFPDGPRRSPRYALTKLLPGTRDVFLAFCGGLLLGAIALAVV